METSKKTIINDPIWGPIELDPLCVRIINTPEFQRLRFIKQLGGCSFVYPGACHSRFEHSIGTSYLAGKLARELEEKLKRKKHEAGQSIARNDIPTITEDEILCLEVAGLCHDLGHGAFSHVFDSEFIKKKEPKIDWEHEEASVKMVTKIFDGIEHKCKYGLKDDDINFIKELIKKPKDGYTIKTEKPFLYEIVANDLNKIDVDKWDYFSRDCHMLGLHHNFQCERSIKLADVVKHGDNWHISFPKTEYYNLFDMFCARFTLHRRAYQHPVNIAVQMMIGDAFLKADKSLKFPPNGPKEKQMCLSKSIDDMEAYLWVTDEVFHSIRALNPEKSGDINPLEAQAIQEEHEIREAEEKRKGRIREAQEILDRILRRDFYKLVGEKKVQWIHNSSNSTRKEEFLKKLKVELKTKIKIEERKDWDDMFTIRKLVFSYGNGEHNPMNNVKFHQKGIAIEVNEEEISDMMPKTFEQIYFQLFWKGTKNKLPEIKPVLKEFFNIKKFIYKIDEEEIECVLTDTKISETEVNNLPREN